MKATIPQDQQPTPLWQEVDLAFCPLSDAVEAAANVLEDFGEAAEDPAPQAAIIGPKLREVRKEVYDRVLALCGHKAQPATRDVKPKRPRTASDLERKVEKILLRLAVSVEAASAVLCHYGDGDSENLALEVASIVGNDVLDTFSSAYGELIALARITVGDDA